MSGLGTGTAPVLELRDISVEFRTDERWVRVVDRVSLQIEPREIFGLVGESGSGKTVTALAAMGLIGPPNGRVEGELLTGGRVGPAGKWRDEAGRGGQDAAIIFQEPRRSLNPVFTVGEQIAEVVRAYDRLPRKEAWERAVGLLDDVGIADAGRRARDYPHQFSGGMCQRAMIAIALACRPRLLIADEPTTALDVTVQAQVLDLLRSLRDEQGIAVLLITHDLGVVADLCDRVGVMYAGELVEEAPVHDLFLAPAHPYTEGLLGSIPDVRHRSARFESIPGVVPRPEVWPAGCRFHPRCPHCEPTVCATERLELRPWGDERRTRCARIDEISLRGIEP